VRCYSESPSDLGRDCLRRDGDNCRRRDCPLDEAALVAVTDDLPHAASLDSAVHEDQVVEREDRRDRAPAPPSGVAGEVDEVGAQRSNESATDWTVEEGIRSSVGA
jgi:hypothetical protein